MVVASAYHSPSGHSRSRERHLVCRDVATVRVVTVELTATVTDSVWTVLDGEPVAVVHSAVSLVPVEAVVTTEGDNCICDGSSSTEELDSVVQVGDDFDVVKYRSASDATKGEAVDFVGSRELCSTVTDGHVTHDTCAVGVVRTTVRCTIVVGRDAFNLSNTTEVGGSVTQEDDTTPLTARVVGHRTVEWVTGVGEDDGALSEGFSVHRTAIGNDECRGGCSGTGGTFDDGSWLDGQGLARVDEDVSIEDVGVVTRPSGCARSLSGVGNDDFRAIGQRRAITLRSCGESRKENRSSKKQMLHVKRG